jgi:catechol 2,3-dioxygenase-like lactoylglutathione lyase family enzyme
MLSVDPDPAAPVSGFFQVDDVDEFHRRHADRITFVDEPQDLPPIRYASFRDPDGNLIRLWTDLEESQKRRADGASVT